MLLTHYISLRLIYVFTLILSLCSQLNFKAHLHHFIHDPKVSHQREIFFRFFSLVENAGSFETFLKVNNLILNDVCLPLDFHVKYY